MISPSQPPEDGGQSSGSCEPARGWRVTDTGGPFTPPPPSISGWIGPMVGIFFRSLSVTFAKLLDSLAVELVRGTFGTATAAAPFGTTTTLTADKEDDCADAFVDVTFTLPVMVLPLLRPVVSTRMFNVSVVSA